MTRISYSGNIKFSFDQKVSVKYDFSKLTDSGNSIEIFMTFNDYDVTMMWCSFIS